MGKNKNGKKRSKGSQLAIRVDKDERDAFVELCEELDTTAAREIRRFMREFVAAHAEADVRAPTPPAEGTTAEIELGSMEESKMPTQTADAIGAVDDASGPGDVAHDSKSKKRKAKH